MIDNAPVTDATDFSHKVCRAWAVTDVTNVTDFLYPPYTCARARHRRTLKSVTSVTSVTNGFVGDCRKSIGGGQ